MLSIKAFFEYGLAFLTLFATVFFLVVFLENKNRVRESPNPPQKLPSLTILIPAFNEEKSIQKTIASAVNADWKNGVKKVVVIDDGSTDSTLLLAKAEAARHTHVTVLHQKNGGKASAMNHALTKIKTDLVATLDADSYIEKNALLKMVGYLDNPNVVAVTAVMKVWNPKKVIEKFQRIEYLLTVFSRKLQSFIHSVNVTPGPLSLFRRSIFNKVGGYDEHNILEDQEMAMRIQGHQYEIASSLDAIVYTRVPDNFSDLISQRVRWHRGGVRNILKHHYLVSPKYGDFGILVMPLAILSIFMVFVVLALATFTILTGAFGELFRFGLDKLYIGITPLHVLSLIIFIATVSWAYLGIRQIKGEHLSAPFLALYLIVYTPLITLFWVVTAIKEIRREKLKW